MATLFTELRTLLYTIRILYPKYNPYFIAALMFKSYHEVESLKLRFTLEPVSNKYLNDAVKSTFHDINNVVVIGSEVFKVLRFPRFAIIKVEQDNTVIRRKVNVLVQNKLIASNAALLNYNLFYNLKRMKMCSLIKWEFQTPKFAEEVQLSVVNTPNNWSNATIDIVLKNYFRAPKLIYVGDIISVCIKDYGQEIFFSTKKIVNINENIYFKCKKIMYENKSISGGYFCVYGETALKQTANVQSFIPPHPNVISNEGLELSLCPFGLENVFKEMQQAVVPFLTTNIDDFKPVFLLECREGSGRHLLINCLAAHFGMHLYTVNMYDLISSAYAQSETKLKNVFFTAKMAAPVILEIKNFQNFGKNNEGEYDERLINHFTEELVDLLSNNEFPVILFCLSNEANIHIELRKLFLKIFKIKAPHDEERKQMLEWILKDANIRTTASLDNIANRTHGFRFEDLKALVMKALINFELSHTLFKAVDGDTLEEKDFNEQYFSAALDKMQSEYNQSIGAPKVPKVEWSDVGGLTDVKEEIINTIKMLLKRPDLLKATGLKRSGILLYGPPGTGKTLIAKAVASECGVCFLSVKGPELLNMYVGQSERNVRKVFETAREASPCIIFFDELDSLAPNRGRSGDSGGVMDRVVSQLLAEMDGLNKSGTVFVIGATNRPDLLDRALLRPGRFDKLLYVGPCTDRKSKLSVLHALTRKFIFANVSLEEVVDMCPNSLSGADLYGICSRAWMSASRRLIRSIENGSGMSAKEATADDVIVTLEDFQSAIRSFKPSIRKKDLEYFEKLKAELSS